MFKRGVAIIAAVVLCSVWAGLAGASDFDPAAATEAYLSTITGEAKAKSDAYFEGGYWFILWNALASIGAALLLLFTRASAGMRNLAESITSWRGLQTFLYGVQFILITSILTFPLTYLEGFVREHDFGLSNMSQEEWLSEYAIGLGVNLVLTSIFIVGLYAVIRRTGEAWWLWATAVSVAFIMFGAAIAPVFISPLFNEYKPMREGALKEEILAMARANGIPADDVYEFNASKQSKRISANVSGFLGTTRISLNDNLLERSSPAEVKAVMAHEIGHYALGHIYEMIIVMAIVAAVSFLFIDIGFGTLNGLFGQWWGIRDFGDTAGLPVLVIMLSVFGLLTTPVTNSIIRTNEAEADIFGLNAAREPDGFATIALKLSEYRKLDPTSLEEIIFFDHPSGRSRISMAMRWKAENLTNAPSQVSEAPAPVDAPMLAPASSGELNMEEPPAFQDSPAMPASLESAAAQ
jgi:STE24 endopeptidase